LLEAVIFPIFVVAWNVISAVEPSAIEMLLDPDVAEKVRDLAVKPPVVL
jgi:hypothetical protein